MSNDDSFEHEKGGRTHLHAYLEDYTDVAECLIALYQGTFETHWLTAADELQAIVHHHFWDEEHGDAFQT